MQEAITKWQAAANLNPVAPDPYIAWGDVLRSQGNYAEALKKHRQALRLNPHSEYLRAIVADELKQLGIH
jgi:tetratricopeptide (TPR) repeat protein